MVKHESYAFGVDVCAVCDLKGENLRRVRLIRPVYADLARTEILIPSGAQMFHPKCYKELKKQL